MSMIEFQIQIEGKWEPFQRGGGIWIFGPNDSMVALWADISTRNNRRGFWKSSYAPLGLRGVNFCHGTRKHQLSALVRIRKHGPGFRGDL